MAKGFIKLDRKLKEWRYADQPYALVIWVHILLSANWKDGWFQGVKITRGSFATSQGNLAKECGCDRNTVKKWLKRFADEEQITVKSTNRFTIISVINWAKYQDDDERYSQLSSQLDSQLSSQLDSQLSSHNRRNNKKERIVRKEEHTTESVRASFTPPSQEEVDQYINAKGYHFTADEFVSFYESNGWKVGRNPMKNWKAACTTWENRRMKSQPSAQRQQPKKAKTFLDMLEEEDRNEQKTDT